MYVPKKHTFTVRHVQKFVCRHIPHMDITQYSNKHTKILTIYINQNPHKNVCCTHTHTHTRTQMHTHAHTQTRTTHTHTYTAVMSNGRTLIHIACLLQPLNSWTGWSDHHTHTATELQQPLTINTNHPTSSLLSLLQVALSLLCWLYWVCLMIVNDHKQNHSRSLIDRTMFRGMIVIVSD